MLAASVIQGQEALATRVLEAVSTQGLAAERIPDQVAVHIPDLVVERIPAQVVGHTPDQVVGRIPAQAVGHIQDQVAGVIPDLVGLQPISGTAHHLIANRSIACAPQWHAVL